MCLIDEHDQFWLIEIARFRHHCINFCKQLKHESREELWLALHISNPEYTNHALAIITDTHQVINLKRWLAKKDIGALLLQFDYFSQNGACTRCSNGSISFLDLCLSLVAD